MKRQAQVESIDALRRMRAHLLEFAEVARASLSEAEAEIGRVRNWLHGEQKAYWKVELRKRQEQVSLAKQALMQKELYKTPTGGRYAAVEERKALTAARRRLEEAETKLQNVKRWSVELDEEAYTYKGQVQGLAFVCEVEVAKIAAYLDRLMTAIEAYVSSAVPREAGVAEAFSDKTDTSGSGDSMKRGGDAGPPMDGYPPNER